MAVFCPLMTLLGPLLGVKALADIRCTPGLGGTRLAAAGIILGLTVSLGWGVTMLWWQSNVREVMIQGPVIEMRAGMRGEYDRVRAGFSGKAAEAPDDVIADFFDELRERYGELLTVRLDVDREMPQPERGRLSPYIPYIFDFEAGEHPGWAKFILIERDPLRLSRTWEAIFIIDDDREDEVTFPPGAERDIEWTGVAPADGDDDAEGTQTDGL